MRQIRPTYLYDITLFNAQTLPQNHEEVTRKWWRSHKKLMNNYGGWIVKWDKYALRISMTKLFNIVTRKRWISHKKMIPQTWNEDKRFLHYFRWLSEIRGWPWADVSQRIPVIGDRNKKVWYSRAIILVINLDSRESISDWSRLQNSHDIGGSEIAINRWESGRTIGEKELTGAAIRAIASSEDQRPRMQKAQSRRNRRSLCR